MLLNEFAALGFLPDLPQIYLAQSRSAAMWFLPFVAPICAWVAYSDLSRMKIPNKAVMTLLAVFLVVGLIAVPLAEYPWRLLNVVVVLAAGFVANMAGVMGAGDAKFLAAAAPFVPYADRQPIMFIFVATLLGAYFTRILFRVLPTGRAMAPNWVSWARRDFPMGLALGGTLTFYLLIAVFRGT